MAKDAYLGKLLSAKEFLALCREDPDPEHNHTCTRCGWMMEDCDCDNKDWRMFCAYCQAVVHQQIPHPCPVVTSAGPCPGRAPNGEEVYCERHRIPRTVAPI